MDSSLNMQNRNGLPVATVLITAFNRKNYIIQSVESVLHQTLDRNEYEIIVSKNFEDNEIDKYLEINGCINILDKGKGIGNRLSNLLPIARSNIIVFLEDDDLFYETKLEEIIRFFKDNEVSYVNNYYLKINDDGELIPYKEQRHNTIILNNSIQMSKNLITLKEQGEYFGMSNLSIRKEKFLPFVETLRRITVSPDLFFFLFSSVISGKSVFFSRRLTLYRSHDSLSNIKGTNEQFFKRRNFFWSLIKEDLNVYSSIAELNTNIEIKKLIDIIALESKIHLFLTSDQIKERITLEDLWNCLKIFVRRKKLFYIKLLTIGTLGYVHKNTAKIIYYIFLK